MQTDAAVGEVLEALDRLGQADRTLVILTSDNGCSPEADFPALLARGHHPSHHFRGHKADIYEGGHRVPFLVRWPGVVRPGATSDQLVCLNDVVRTAADAAGLAVPTTAAEDSFSFLPVLRGEQSAGLRTAVVHHSINGSFAIREGDWKLCLCPGSGGWSAPRPGRDDVSQLPPMQLFNLHDDVGEQHNLQADHPEVVTRLTTLLETLVMNGRSTPGPAQSNAVPVEIRKAERPRPQP
jgi:arylsulfatase A-like enzyme